MNSIVITRLISEKLEASNYEVIEESVVKGEEINGLKSAKNLVMLEENLEDYNSDTPFMNIMFESDNEDQKFDDKDLQELAKSKRSRLLAGIK